VTDRAPLALLGRKFDGFERALTMQLKSVPEPGATFELLEIEALQQAVLDGNATESGDYDVMMLISDWLPALISGGRLLPLDDYFAREAPQGWPSAWVPSLRELQLGPDGKTYGIAYHDGPMLLLYRKDLYADPGEQAGFEAKTGYSLAPPQSWAQYRDQALWFNRPGEGLYGTVLAGYPDEHNNVYDFLMHLWSRGGELIDVHGRSGLDSPAAREAIDFIHDLWHVDQVVNPEAAQWDSVASGVHFAAGEAAMMVNWCGFAALSADPTSPTHDLVACASAPGGSGPQGSVVTMNAYWVLTVPVGARDAGRSVDLLRALSTHEMDVLTALGGASATRRDSWSDPQVQATSPYYEVLEQAHLNARSVPVDARWPQLADILNRMMHALVTDATAAHTALTAAHLELNTLLATTAPAQQ
jgi:multiple sugar transport system substrate-binding protein